MKLKALILFLTLFQVDCVNVKDLELVLVQAIWRHGDRAPQEPFPSDPIKESDWVFGGGGYGELTTYGMRQHFKLGQALRQRYINETFKFLEPNYNAKKMYVHSTDRNRTIISALSNVYGMFSVYNNYSTEGINYPNYPGWTPHFIPIAVHTSDYDSDCIRHDRGSGVHPLWNGAKDSITDEQIFRFVFLLDNVMSSLLELRRNAHFSPQSQNMDVANVECHCPRRTKLQEMAHTLPEYVNYTTSNEMKSILENLTISTGKTITADNFWTVPDTLLCERIHFMDILRKENNWYSESYYNQLQKINHRLNYFTCGIYAPPAVVNGINVTQEIIRLRSGPITNEIYNRMKTKMACLDDKCTNSFMKNLQFYAYSAHDETIYALMTALGIQDQTGLEKGEWPQYSASIVVELFKSKKSNDAYFSIVYRKDENSTFVPLTKYIDQCDGDICKLDTFKVYADKYNPGDVLELCQQLPSYSSSTFSIIASISVLIVSLIRY